MRMSLSLHRLCNGFQEPRFKLLNQVYTQTLTDYSFKAFLDKNLHPCLCLLRMGIWDKSGSPASFSSTSAEVQCEHLWLAAVLAGSIREQRWAGCSGPADLLDDFVLIQRLDPGHSPLLSAARAESIAVWGSLSMENNISARFLVFADWGCVQLKLETPESTQCF